MLLQRTYILFLNEFIKYSVTDFSFRDEIIKEQRLNQ